MRLSPAGIAPRLVTTFHWPSQQFKLAIFRCISAWFLVACHHLEDFCKARVGLQFLPNRHPLTMLRSQAILRRLFQVFRPPPLPCPAELWKMPAPPALSLPRREEAKYLLHKAS